MTVENFNLSQKTLLKILSNYKHIHLYTSQMHDKNVSLLPYMLKSLVSEVDFAREVDSFHIRS